MAREGLAQDAPVVAAVRRELGMGDLPEIDGLDIAGVLSPAEGVLAGDWWDARLLPSGLLAVSLCDVSGHGPEAGICALRVRHVIVTVLESGGSPAEAITAAGRSFAAEEERFATVVVMTVDPLTGSVCWANAGHHPPLMLGGVESRLEATGPLLSCLGGGWQDRQCHLGEGQAILAFTDGLLESHDRGGRELEEEGIRGLVGPWPGDHLPGGVAELVAAVTAAARQRAADWQRDDVTVVALARP